MSHELPPQAVLLDFDHTLFAFDNGVGWVRAARSALTPDPDEPADRQLWDRIESARTRPDVVEARRGCQCSPQRHRRATLSWFRSAGTDPPMADALYNRLTDPGGWAPYRDTREFLLALHTHRVPVAVVSNVGWDIRPTFKHHGLAGLVDTFVLSCEQGVEKPDPTMFLAACRQLAVQPERTLMVGDDPVNDGAAVRTGSRVHLLPARTRGGCRGLLPILDLVTEVRTPHANAHHGCRR
jgi:HAD superfamily hydrolase (TIGR01509 family)